MHNGDPKNGSPHWQIIVWEDGKIRGEILTKGLGRFLPKDFKLDNFQYFFKIPPELANKRLATIPPREEIIISLDVLSGDFGSFLLSDVPKGSDLRKAIEEAVEKISAFAKQLLSNTAS
jgi:hypothetical protein